jgi:hypothetical protein
MIFVVFVIYLDFVVRVSLISTQNPRQEGKLIPMFSALQFIINAQTESSYFKYCVLYCNSPLSYMNLCHHYPLTNFHA